MFSRLRDCFLPLITCPAQGRMIHTNNGSQGMGICSFAMLPFFPCAPRALSLHRTNQPRPTPTVHDTVGYKGLCCTKTPHDVFVLIILPRCCAFQDPALWAMLPTYPIHPTISRSLRPLPLGSAVASFLKNRCPRPANVQCRSVAHALRTLVEVGGPTPLQVP